jgi:hypothetical protein
LLGGEHIRIKFQMLTSLPNKSLRFLGFELKHNESLVLLVYWQLLGIAPYKLIILIKLSLITLDNLEMLVLLSNQVVQTNNNESNWKEKKKTTF